jgi:4-alpha-glucanotransferase
MNALGTHDTLRILTYLGLGDTRERASKEWKASHHLNQEELARGVRRLKLGTDVLFTFPGAPTVYYGDEVGMEGFEDPYNRRTYPWGYENQTLLAHYRTLGNLRKNTQCLRTGTLRWGPCRGHVLSFYRKGEGETVATAVNAGVETEYVTLPWEQESATDVLTGTTYSAKNGSVTLVLHGESGVVLCP